MQQIMIAAKTGTVTLDGQRRMVRKGVTTAHAGHELVDRYPHLWQPIQVHYPVDEPDDDEPSPVDPPADDEPSPATVRAWAKDQGIDVPPRGRVPAEVIEQYRQAHGQANGG